MTNLVVRNTFLELQDDAPDASNSMRRSASSPSLSSGTDQHLSSSTPSRDEDPLSSSTNQHLSSSTPSREEPHQQFTTLSPRSHHLLFTSTPSSSSQPTSSKSGSRFTTNDGEHYQEDDGMIHYTREDEDIPSIGSRSHAEGLCKPCRFMVAKAGCSKGANCNFCHFPHENAYKKVSYASRPCKEQRQRFQQLMDSLDAYPSDSVEFARAASRLAEKHPFLKKKLMESLEGASLAHEGSETVTETNQSEQGKVRGGRLGKVKRERYKNIISQLDQKDPAVAQQQALNLAEQHPYLKKKLQHWLVAGDSPDTQSKPEEDYYSPQLPVSSAAQSSTFAGKYGYKISL